MNDRKVSGETLNAISEDVFLLSGFTELVKAYQDKKAELTAEARDKAEYFITSYLGNLATGLKETIDSVI